jgi:glucosamine-6-phosphate deaminase
MRTVIDGSPHVQIFSTFDEMGARAAQDIADQLRRLLAAETDAHVRMLFAAAPSQQSTLENLAVEPGIDWSRVTAFHLDEYLALPAYAPQGFGTWLRTVFFDKVPIQTIHLIDPQNDPGAEILRYAALLAEAPMDIACIGIGDNGHIAFNEPPDADFDDPDAVRVVQLDERSRVQQVDDGLFATLDDVPRRALTLTIPTVLGARSIFCMVPGERKRAAVHAALYGPVTSQCPASVLRTHPSCAVYLDTDAAPQNG